MQKGQALIFLLVGIFMIAAIAGAFYLGRQTTIQSSPAPAITPQTPQPASSSPAAAAPTSSAETVYTEGTRSANWKTYTNTKYSFSFKYPQNWYIDEKNTHNDPIRFFKVGDEAPATWTQRMAKGKEQLIVSVSKDQSFEELTRSLNLDNSDSTFKGKQALKYATGIYILLDSKQNIVLSIYRPQYPDGGFLDQILSTFKFTP